MTPMLHTSDIKTVVCNRVHKSDLARFLQENIVTIFWPLLYNSLPKYLSAKSAKTKIF